MKTILPLSIQNPGNGVELSSYEFKFYQPTDCCQTPDDGQELVVKSESGGGGNFLVIETKRWAMDDGGAWLASLLSNLEKLNAALQEIEDARPN